jgi:hypothetical protein
MGARFDLTSSWQKGLAAAALALFFAVPPAHGEDASGSKAPRAGASTEDKKPSPVLTIDDPIYDWGKAYQGEQIEHTFTVENKGGSTLIIEDVKSHCGCTVLRENDYKKMLEPGEKTSITINLDTTLLKGSVKKDTEVFTNALADENKLWMQGDVEELLILTPSMPKVEVVRASTAPPIPPALVRIEPNLGKTVKLSSVVPLKGFLAASLREVAAGKKYELSLSPTLKKEDKTAFQTEALETRVEVDGKALVLRLQVSVVQKERIDVSPSKSIYFHRKMTEGAGKPGGQKPAMSLEVESIGGPAHRFKITKTAVKNQVFKVALETVEEGRHYRLQVVLDKTPEKGERFLRDSIELTTDDPEVPLLTIPAMAQF